METVNTPDNSARGAEVARALSYIADSIKDCQKSLVSNELDSLTELKDITDTFGEVMKGNEELIAEFNKPDALVRPIITPSFVPSCTPEMLRACGELAAKYQLPVQSHLSENKDEIAWVQSLEKDSNC